MKQCPFSVFDKYLSLQQGVNKRIGKKITKRITKESDKRTLILTVSEVSDGSMKFIGKEKEDKIVFKNRKRFLKKLKIVPNQLVNAGLVHGSKVKIVNKKDKGKKIKKTDGLTTEDKNVFLAITVADCLPIFIFAPPCRVIGLVHGGWRSLAKNILKESIEKFKKEFETKPENILVGIGPGIGKCHFEVKEDVADKFKSFDSVLEKRNNKTFLDLKKTAKIQLIKLGLKEKNIEINPECTFCEENKYFSYRRNNSDDLIGKTKVKKAMLAVFGQR